MSENNGDHTTSNNERSEQPEQTGPVEAAQVEAAQSGPSDTGQSAQSETAQPEVAPNAAAAHAAPAAPHIAPRSVQQPWGQPAQTQPAQTQPAQTQSPQGLGQHGYGVPVSPASPQTSPQGSPQTSQHTTPMNTATAMNTAHAGAPVPPAEGPDGYGAPTPTSNLYTNPTERIPAPPAYSAGSHKAPAHGEDSQGAANHGAGASSYGEGYAGPGYPTSNAYPQNQPQSPAVAPHGKNRGGKKVGMGMFTTGVLAAALVGGLVGGGSLFLLDQQTDNSSANTTSQSAPLVVNNTNSVNQVTAAAAKAMPSVVTISATSGSSGGTGSGIILDAEGHILTNTHVVTLDGAAAHAAIQVQTSDNKVYEATIVGTDPLSDLAVIKVDAPNLVPAALGESSNINVGDTVIAIGSPLGLNATVTEGIVSTLNRTIQVASSAVPETPSDASEDPDNGDNGFQFSPPGGGTGSAAATGTVNLNVIQTDAAINPGNSGGALVNSEGQIIGVNVAIASTGSASGSSSQSGNIGVGFSIPMDHAKRVATDIIKTGSASHGQLGVTVSGTSASGSSSSFSAGATVAEVTSGSAAAKAGLKKGDVIGKLGNRTISDPSDLTAAVREQPGGATVKMDFTRDGKAQSIDVILDTME